MRNGETVRTVVENSVTLIGGTGEPGGDGTGSWALTVRAGTGNLPESRESDRGKNLSETRPKHLGIHDDVWSKRRQRLDATESSEKWKANFHEWKILNVDKYLTDGK